MDKENHSVTHMFWIARAKTIISLPRDQHIEYPELSSKYPELSIKYPKVNIENPELSIQKNVLNIQN